MSAGRCHVTWKAAALADGRLDGADRASFDDHASRCADCRAERASLAALDARMRALPVTSVSPLDHARRRGTLLERADERFLARRRRSAPARWALITVGVLALAVTAMSVARLRPRASSSVAGATSNAPRFEVVEAPHAIWRTSFEGAIARVDLADGEATFQVEHLAAPQRFLVALPDGEVEVAGTRFTVSVALGRTSRVSVVDGDVVFRRRDHSELTLHAGEGWSRTEVVAEHGESGRTAGSSATTAAASAPAVSAGRAPVAPAAARRTAAVPAMHQGGEKFDGAIGSFVSGSYARADDELREFIQQYPQDARCEDASFLRAVARWRLGDPAGARERAEAYLAAYPQGLRRTEAQHILDDAR